jgi:predicted Zn-dependent protease
MRSYVDDLSRDLFGQLQGQERATLYLGREDSTFIRFNQAKIRQMGEVQQRELSLRLVEGQRHATAELNLTGEADDDRAQLRRALADLRQNLTLLPEDPHLCICWEGPSIEKVRAGTPPAAAEVVRDLVQAAGTADLVGYYAGGQVQRGFWSSTGLKHWYSAPSWTLDWSLHLPDRDGERRAVKAILGGDRWEQQRLEQRMVACRRELAALERPLIHLKPGEYRTLLAPDGLAELVNLAGWGLGAMALHTRSSVWLRQQGGQRLHPSFSLVEDTENGFSPPFQGDGFAKAGTVELVTEGALVGQLVSPRSARELGLEQNGASESELPESLAMAGGELREEDQLRRLDTGLYVSNLWYTNVSDRSAGRVTGLTRFATLWVEKGEIIGPVPTMRFDDTLGRMWGTELEALGATPELIPSTDSWGWRSTASWRLPALLMRSWRLTL